MNQLLMPRHILDQYMLSAILHIGPPGYLVTNLVTNLSPNLVITKFLTKFGEKFVTEFGDSLNLSPDIVTYLSPNLVTH